MNKNSQSAVTSRLIKLGVDDKLHQDVLKVLSSEFGSSISDSTLDALGDNGMLALVDSIRLNHQNSYHWNKNIQITVPHHRAEWTLDWREGQSILDLSKEDQVLSEYLVGACGGNMACCSCHIYLNSEAYEALGPPTIEEEDMLDLAQNRRDTSRLGCQVHLGNSLKNVQRIQIIIPDGVTNVW
jgi:ferredoxin